MPLTFPMEGKLYRHSLLKLQLMVAFITCNSNFAIGPPYPKQWSVTVTLGLTKFSIIYTYYTYFCYFTDHENDKLSQKSIIYHSTDYVSNHSFTKNVPYSWQRPIHNKDSILMSCQGASPSSAHLAPLMTPFPCQQTLTVVIRLWSLKSRQRILSPAYLSRSTCSNRVVFHAVQIKLLELVPIAAIANHLHFLWRHYILNWPQHQKEIQNNEFRTLDYTPPPFHTYTHTTQNNFLTPFSDTSISLYTYINVCGST
jgi:hypothetical protein